MKKIYLILVIIIITITMMLCFENIAYADLLMPNFINKKNNENNVTKSNSVSENQVSQDKKNNTVITNIIAGEKDNRENTTSNSISGNKTSQNEKNNTATANIAAKEKDDSKNTTGLNNMRGNPILQEKEDDTNVINIVAGGLVIILVAISAFIIGKSKGKEENAKK